jgi:hypothetical protein
MATEKKNDIEAIWEDGVLVVAAWVPCGFGVNELTHTCALVKKQFPNREWQIHLDRKNGRVEAINITDEKKAPKGAKDITGHKTDRPLRLYDDAGF